MESSAGSEREITGRDARHWRGAPALRGAGGAADFRAAGSSGPVVPDSPSSPRRAAAVRVLVAIENRHRVYREAIGEFLRSTRPGFEVRVVSPRGLYGQMRRFGPQIVVYAGSPTPIPDLLPCWVELSLDPTLPTVLWTGRVRREVGNPSMTGLLEAIEEAAPVCL